MSTITSSLTSLSSNKGLPFKMYQGMNLSTFKALFPDFEVVPVEHPEINHTDKYVQVITARQNGVEVVRQVIGFVA